MNRHGLRSITTALWMVAITLLAGAMGVAAAAPGNGTGWLVWGPDHGFQWVEASQVEASVALQARVRVVVEEGNGAGEDEEVILRGLYRALERLTLQEQRRLMERVAQSQGRGPEVARVRIEALIATMTPEQRAAIPEPVQQRLQERLRDRDRLQQDDPERVQDQDRIRDRERERDPIHLKEGPQDPPQSPPGPPEDKGPSGGSGGNGAGNGGSGKGKS